MHRRVKSVDACLADAGSSRLRRSLGPIQLAALGVGAIVGTGIFVLTAIGAERAGPALLLSFVIAAAVCGLAALAYAELAAMIPIAGSAYTYSYVIFGEFVAWLVGWNLILEYAAAASAVAVGWSGYILGLFRTCGINLPIYLSAGALASPGGGVNVVAVVIVAIVTVLLVVGTRTSAAVTSALVAIKLTALLAFVLATIPAFSSGNLASGVRRPVGPSRASWRQHHSFSWPILGSTRFRPRPRKRGTQTVTFRLGYSDRSGCALLYTSSLQPAQLGQHLISD